MAKLPSASNVRADKLPEVRPEVAMPGFWSMLAQNSQRWSEELSVGPFWAAARAQLDQWRTEYRSNTAADLLASVGLPNFVSKSEASIQNKVARRFPEGSESSQKAFLADGPPIPQIGDLVRTRIACRYIDGVEFLSSKLVTLANEMGLSPVRSREGRIDGYFAQHITVSQEVIFRFVGQTQLANIACEIQVASEMATRMWDAAHPLYEQVREGTNDPEEWQWKPDDPRFISHQLGHMIHLADGLLVQLHRLTCRKASR
jgi:ppGpp synthetase/RelA/SpoT-type nucleotidyltranferase